jgi:4-hydroxy-3-methylbut-2-enyl diphosphate reductase
MKEAQMVVDYMLNDGSGLDKEAFLKYFENAISKGFDPDIMLQKLGLANQTTMYKKETKAIGQLFQKTMMKKHGPSDVNAHYYEFDTICDATQVRGVTCEYWIEIFWIMLEEDVACWLRCQRECNVTLLTMTFIVFVYPTSQERQDAVSELVENSKNYGLDFILVIGGWDSSNTAHLLEIPHMAKVRSFHINRADCIGADNTITHRTVDGEIVTEPFLMDLEKDVVMGVTSGASTPDAAIQDSLGQIFLLKKMLGSSK